jgi:hypothetical protein
MSVVEQDLTYLVLPPSLFSLTPGSEISSFTLISGPNTRFPGFEWKLEFPFPHAYRILLSGPDRPRPPHDNANAPAVFSNFMLLSLDKDQSKATFAFPSSAAQAGNVFGLNDERLELRLCWSYQLFSEVWQVGNGGEKLVLRDLQARSYGLQNMV